MKKFSSESQLPLDRKILEAAGPVAELGQCPACSQKLAVLLVARVIKPTEQRLVAIWSPLQDIKFCPFCGEPQEKEKRKATLTFPVKRGGKGQAFVTFPVKRGKPPIITSFPVKQKY